MNRPSSDLEIPRLKLLINGQWIESATEQWGEVINPATQQVLAYVPYATTAEINAAIDSAQAAFASWRQVAIGVRARIFLKYQALIRANMAELAALTPGDLVVHQDHGIGRYEGLISIPVGNSPHDCVALTYSGGD